MRAVIIVIDSLGIGDAPDARAYGDEGANTLTDPLNAVPGLQLSNLWSLGLGNVIARDALTMPDAAYGAMIERSAGKDSTSGHWEMAGLITEAPFALFRSFSPELLQAIEREANVHFIGNRPASGTQIIEELGPEHIRSGNPILYTSADSVLQIAAHEQVIAVDRLHWICRIARKHCDPYRIGRVIARPFIGSPGQFQRTANRHDYSYRPARTVLDQLCGSDIDVISIGKPFDLFAGCGFTRSHPTRSNEHGLETMAEIWPQVTNGLVFCNLVDFDSIYGHRRDIPGFARVLSEFDWWLGEFLPQVAPEDLLIITADHGNDPTYRGTGHTRERVPILLRHRHLNACLGIRETLADIAATLTDFYNLPPWPIGQSLLCPRPAVA